MSQTNYEEIIELITDRIEDVLDHFGIQYVKYDDRVSFSCPIHGSDNPESLSIFITGHSTTGNWKCWTNECEQEILNDTDNNGQVIERERGRTIFGFLRGILSVEKDRHVEYSEAIQWAKDFVGYKGTSLEETAEDLEIHIKKRFVKDTNILLKKRKVLEGDITRQEIRGKLRIPAQYFVGRGFLSETLDKYDVGFCETKKTQMFNRVVVPVYDDDYEKMVGCVGRTIQPKCHECGKFHYPDRACPSNNLERLWASKWVNSKGFNAESTLYNIWFAKQHIAECGIAILVEGQADVWRLEEADIHIGLGLFGDSLTDEQKMILDSSGALTLLILTDADDAGLKARKRILEKCKRSYNCMFIDLPKKDIGDMTVEQVKFFLGPILEKVLCHRF